MKDSIIEHFVSEGVTNHTGIAYEAQGEQSEEAENQSEEHVEWGWKDVAKYLNSLSEPHAK